VLHPLGMGNNSCSCSLEEGTAVATPERQITASPGYTRATIHRWDFNVLDLVEGQLHQVAIWLLEHKRGEDCTLTDRHRLAAFTQQVFRGYLPNPYHNVFHAVDVMHAVFLYGELVPWHDLFPVQMQYALLVGALSHDIGHFGLTNAFLVDMRDGLAIQYNDISPLENMHCSKLYAILQEDKTNVFEHFSPQEYRDLRKMVIDAILHTDMSHHGEMAKDLKELGSKLPAKAPDIISKEQIEVLNTGPNKTIMARVLLHGADLSNPAKPWNIAYSWAQNVLAEFFAQGDKEKALGLPVGMLNDREKVNLPNSQIGFTQFVVAPFLSSCTKVFGAWRKIAAQLGVNTEAWGKMWCAEVGKDEDERVGKILIALGLKEEPKMEIVASTGGTDGKEPAPEKIADSPAKPLESTGASREWSRHSSIPALTNGSNNNYPRAAHAVVRELRRWREDQVNTDNKRHRELVLLYVLSDGDIVAAEGKEILLKYNTRNSHFSDPVPLEDEPKVVSVAVAADNMCSFLDRDSFDHLLTALLEKRARY